VAIRAFVGLGANVGDPPRAIREALSQLTREDGIRVAKVSGLRETDPVGYEDQPRFLNGAAELETSLSARELLERLLAIERRLGRVRGDGPRFGPRTIDLDLLLYGEETIDEPGLQIPHPRLHERMSHLDELDEFEAELELALKKEYSAVFALFRYCVLTQDATYLCNKLDLQYVPQPSYPFFQLKMEDVWVWDKNRPTRIIPRAEVYTSSDVTVEELRGEGDEPSLTAEALAERIGESLGSDDEL